MVEIALLDIIGSLAGLLAISTGSTVAYVHWRLKRLEQCVDRAADRMDRHLDRGAVH